METLVALIGLAAMLFVFGGAAVAWYSVSKVRKADAKIKELTQAVLHLKSLVVKLQSSIVEHNSSELISPKVDSKQHDKPQVVTQSDDQFVEQNHSKINQTNVPKPHPKVTFEQRLQTFLDKNGLLWIGAGVLALGGVFLAKYSIEADLISIGARLVLGGLFALALIVFSEYMYRKHNASSSIAMTCAALSSGGVITGFALVMVTFSYYQYISPLIAFLSLAAISFLATGLSLRFGPILAVIGLIGAYAVPALVNTDSKNLFALLMYVNLVSVAAIWVAQTVQKDWLWWQSFVGHFLWIFVSIVVADLSDAYLIAFSLLVAQYLYGWSSVLGWRMTTINRVAMELKLLLMPRKEQLAVIVAFFYILLFYALHGFAISLVIISGLFCVISFILPLRHSAFDSWPFLALLMVVYTIFLYPMVSTFDEPMLVFSGVLLFSQIIALVFFGYALYMVKNVSHRPSFALLLVISPSIIMGLSYVLSPTEIDSVLFPVWSCLLLLMAMFALWQSNANLTLLNKIALWVLANTHLALIFTMWLNASTLTLALCAQLTLLAMCQRRYQVALPTWLTKLGLSVVLFRVTVSPWMKGDNTEMVLGVHWSLIVIPLVFSMVYYAYYLHHSIDLKKWLEGALLHLVALFITLETSYFLVGQYPDFNNLSFAETAVLAMNWLILSAVYLWRFKLAHKHYYLIMGSLLALASGILQLVLNTRYNPFLNNIQIGHNFVFNWLAIIWLIPALILFAINRLKLIPKSLNIHNNIPLVLFAFLICLFINGTIRAYFQQGQIWLKLTTSQAEIYMYSIVWLIVSAGLIITAQRKQHLRLNQVGFGILLVVILKAFLFDMRHLDGLYRAVSFIGLGLSLVALGWLFTRVKAKNHQVIA